MTGTHLRGWEKIETAPKDGSIFLGGYFFQSRWIYRLAKWNAYHKDWNNYPGHHVAPVTHWMPLPEAPQW
jgi:hypothetical protein